MNSTATWKTRKGHELTDGAVFTYLGKTKAGAAAPVQVCLVQTAARGDFDLFDIVTNAKVLSGAGSATRFWAAE